MSFLPAVFCVSFVTIGWQLALMRCLHITRYHHFSFLIISCALLGFGASGTMLSLCREWVDRYGNAIFCWGIVAFGISLPLCFRLAQALPIEVYFPPGNLIGSLAWWFLFWLVNAAPFLVAGGLIGLALILGAGRAHTVYAINLLGSAAGALGSIQLFYWMAPNDFVAPLSLLALASGFFLPAEALSWGQRTYRIVLSVVTLLLVGLNVVAERVFPLSIDQYKSLSFVRSLVNQGGAEKRATLLGPRGVVELYGGPHFHTLLSLSSNVTPPPMDVLIRDGFHAGSILCIERPDQARFLEGTLSALPYKLVSPQEVLILGETG
ncbi:MAG: hypothetical protein FJY85_23435, partial [Deltaproteobacteria bacterium]|nr:hypothetical protein [Deltaproteobacteria bacterium]